MANTCAPSVCGWCRTRSPGGDILGLKKGHGTRYTAVREGVARQTHDRLIRRDGKATQESVCDGWATQKQRNRYCLQNSEVTVSGGGGGGRNVPRLACGSVGPCPIPIVSEPADASGRSALPPAPPELSRNAPPPPPLNNQSTRDVAASESHPDSRREPTSLHREAEHRAGPAGRSRCTAVPLVVTERGGWTGGGLSCAPVGGRRTPRKWTSQEPPLGRGP